MKQLKDALVKAGVVTKNTLANIEKEKVKKKNKRHDKRDKKEQLSIVCDACDKSAPDVEKYIHDNKRIWGKLWLCIQCADEYQIDDKCRETEQSPQSKSGLFIRRYGRTRKFSRKEK